MSPLIQCTVKGRILFFLSLQQKLHLQSYKYNTTVSEVFFLIPRNSFDLEKEIQTKHQTNLTAGDIKWTPNRTVCVSIYR
jgi:hypothetical protein